jgi:ubiquinone biosynthesis protein Coq4
VGEVTGSYALSKIMAGMMNNDVGRRILHERPLVDELVASRALEMLQTYNADNNMTMDASNIDGGSKQNPDSSGTTTTKSPSLGREAGTGIGGEGIPFGVAYAEFLQLHEFDPNERSSVRFISDPDLSYVMTRYRQCHDYWHVLTGLPPTVLGELSLKWVELLQTGLPLAALSATAGAWGVSSTSLNDREREVLWNVYLPWAVRVGGNMKPHALMCVYYEEEFETDLNVLRERVGIELAPRVEV